MKKLETTVDFPGCLIKQERNYSAEDVDRMIDIMYSFGIRKIDWIYDTWWTYYRYTFAEKKNMTTMMLWF